MGSQSKRRKREHGGIRQESVGRKKKKALDRNPTILTCLHSHMIATPKKAFFECHYFVHFCIPSESEF
jgi:hypothetical protein